MSKIAYIEDAIINKYFLKFMDAYNNKGKDIARGILRSIPNTYRNKVVNKINKELNI